MTATGKAIKDVSDWLDAGHTVGELLGLLQAAPSWSPAAVDFRPAPSPSATVADVLAAAGLASLGQDPPLENVETALRTLRDHLDGADPLRRGIVREAAVRALAKTGVGSPSALVDAALRVRAEDDDQDDLQGRVVTLSDPDPWLEPVDGADLLNELLATLTRFLALPPGGAVALSMWIVHAHAHAAAAVSPMIVFKSATKRAGKTTALTVMNALVPRPLQASNVTGAALFRTVEKFKPTLLVDEADSFLANSDELRGILNSGHTRSGAVVIRTVGDDHEPRSFSTWCPKTIALIGNLPATLEDRSIVIAMRRRSAKEKVERLRLDRLQELEPVRRRATRWAKDNLEVLRRSDPVVPEQLHDRAADNWRPLLAIADLCGGLWPEEARHASLLLSGTALEEDNAPAIQLLADLRDLFRTKDRDRLSSKQIVEMLATMEDRPWPEWKKGGPITETQLARLLKSFSVGPKVIRLMDGSTPRGYLLADLADAFSRYLPPEVQQPQQAREVNELPADARCNTNLGVAPRESVEKAHQLRIVADVASPQADLAERSVPNAEPPSTDREHT